VKQVDVKIGEVVLAKIGAAFVRVRVLSTINYGFDTRTRFVVARLDTGKTLPKARKRVSRRIDSSESFLRSRRRSERSSLN
jgi:hypothetical protein